MKTVSSVIRDALVSAAKELSGESLSSLRMLDEVKKEYSQMFHDLRSDIMSDDDVDSDRFIMQRHSERPPKYVPDDERNNNSSRTTGRNKTDKKTESDSGKNTESGNLSADEKPPRLYSERLEMLIDAAVTDGIINEQEMKVLARQAVVEKVDPNEFQMVVEARLYERQRQLKQQLDEKRNTDERARHPSASAATVRRENSTRRKINKCPSCGAILSAVSVNCPNCGYLFVTSEHSDKVNEFFSRMSQLEVELDSEAAEAIDNDFMEEPKAMEARKTLSAFVCPVSGPEIVRFVSLANNHVRFVDMRMNKYQRMAVMELNSLWVNKMTEVCRTAEVMMSNDQATLGRLRAILVDAKNRNRKTSGSYLTEKTTATFKKVAFIAGGLFLLWLLYHILKFWSLFA